MDVLKGIVTRTLDSSNLVPPSPYPLWLLTTLTPFLSKSQFQCVCPNAHETIGKPHHGSPVNSVANALFVGPPTYFGSPVPSMVGAWCVKITILL